MQSALSRQPCCCTWSSDDLRLPACVAHEWAKAAVVLQGQHIHKGIYRSEREAANAAWVLFCRLFKLPADTPEPPLLPTSNSPYAPIHIELLKQNTVASGVATDAYTQVSMHRASGHRQKLRQVEDLEARSLTGTGYALMCSAF